MDLRPHHVLDIVTSIGHDVEFRPHPYGHAVHTVAEAILADTDLEATLVVAADEICRPCVHLQPDGSCDDLRSSSRTSKQEYNDDLDRRLLEYLGLQAGATMTVRQYLEIVNGKVPGIEAVCTHPPRDPQKRLAGLTRGLEKLGIRSA